MKNDIRIQFCNDMDIYDLLVRASKGNKLGYYRCSSDPKWAAFDFELTQDMFGELTDAFGRGYALLTISYDTVENAQIAFDSVMDAARGAHLDYKLVFYRSGSELVFVINKTSGRGIPITNASTELTVFMMLLKGGNLYDYAIQTREVG